MLNNYNNASLRGSVMVSTSAWHAVGRGSILGVKNWL